VITGFSPNQGAVGQKVTIYGHNLGGAEVLFHGVPAMNVTVDATNSHVTFVVPTGAEVGPGQIQVTTPGGTATTATNFTVTQTVPPTPQTKAKSSISNFAPMRGKVGTSVVIKGINLGGAMWVKFGGVKAVYTVPTNSKIVARVPKNAHSGQISIKTSSGITTNSLRFTVLPGGST